MKPTEQALLEDAASKLEATPYLNLYDAGDNRVVPDTRALARAIRAALGMDAALSATQQPVSEQGVVVPVGVLNEAAGVLDCEGYGPLSLALLSCLPPAPNAIEADTLGEREG